MNNDDLCQIDLVLKSKQLSQLQKCQEFIVYLVEVGYDLAINPDMNVSHSRGISTTRAQVLQITKQFKFLTLRKDF